MAFFAVTPQDSGQLKTSRKIENAFPGYRIFSVDWRVIHAEEAGTVSFGQENFCPRVLVNLDRRIADFSSPPHSLPCFHFSVLDPAVRNLKMEGPGKLIAVDLDTLPLFPERKEKTIDVHPVPSAATSLVECLAKESGEVPSPQMVRALMELLAPTLFRGTEDEELADFRSYVLRHLGEQISTEDIASELGMSTSPLRQKTRDAIGMTPAVYLREARIHLARDLLATTTISIEQIAERTGYSDRFSFTRAFTGATSVSPNTYRESMMAQRAKS